ncbi:MAG: beta-ketoacyl-[acyl-carrier-protein] synthase family protein [Thermoguttaceae bacterium]
MSSEPRVVITGLGVISPLAVTPDTLLESLIAERSGVVALGQGLPVSHAALCSLFTGKFEDFIVPNEGARRLLRKGIKLMSREIQMAVAVAGYALADSSLTPDHYAPQRVGVSFGCDYILTTPDEVLEAVKACLDDSGRFDFSRWVSRGMPLMTPLWQLKYLPNMPASHIAIYNDLQGPSNSITLREASIGAVMAESAAIIKRGRADAMLVGTTGSRTLLSKMIQGVQQETVARESDESGETACRPFDRNRCGTVLGEGAAALLLESLDAARSRGATIYGEVVSAATLGEWDRKTPTSRELLTRLIRDVVARSGIDAESLGHVNAHGLGDIATDATEAAAIADVVGDRVPVTSIKGHCGQMGAGGGAVEVVASIMSLRSGTLFPTKNHVNTAPDCPIRVATGTATPSGDSFLKLAFDHQGQASAVIVRR